MATARPPSAKRRYHAGASSLERLDAFFAPDASSDEMRAYVERTGLLRADRCPVFFARVLPAEEWLIEHKRESCWRASSRAAVTVARQRDMPEAPPR